MSPADWEARVSRARQQARDAHEARVRARRLATSVAREAARSASALRAARVEKARRVVHAAAEGGTLCSHYRVDAVPVIAATPDAVTCRLCLRALGVSWWARRGPEPQIDPELAAGLPRLLDLHRRWILGEPGGERLDLRGECMRGASLRHAVLTGALLDRADFCGADLRDAWLAGASLTGARFDRAQLDGADFGGAARPVARARSAA